MKKEGLYAAGLACLMYACTGTPQSSVDKLGLIDVAGAMEKPAELKLSELGGDAHYVALETTDSSLIGRNPGILLLEKHIAVISGKECLMFNKETGKFLTKIGHVGEDPEAYSDPTPIYNDTDGLLYFMRRPATLQKYDLQGNYHGKLTIPVKPAIPSDFCFADSLVIGHYNGIIGYNASSLLFFNSAGERLDTIPSLSTSTPEITVKDISDISILKQGNAGILLSRSKKGESSTNIIGIPFLWKTGKEVHFKESFNDTIYTVQRNGLVPYFVFATGKWHLDYKERINFVESKDRLEVSCIYETKDNLFFQCLRGYPQTYNGIYNRKAKTTHMNEEKKGFTDDFTGFMTFHPKTCSLQGEYGMLVEAADAMDWLEEHPEIVENSKLAALKKLTEDSNPVAVVTVPK